MEVNTSEIAKHLEKLTLEEFREVIAVVANKYKIKVLKNEEKKTRTH